MKYGRKRSINIYNYLSYFIYNRLPYSFNINTIRLIILIYACFSKIINFELILFMFGKIIFVFVFYIVHKNMIYGFVNLLFLFYL